MSGKGSAPRPFSVDADTFASNWERIFKKEGQGESQPDKHDDKPAVGGNPDNQ